MIEGSRAIQVLVASGVRLFVGVPDSLMEGFCSALGSCNDSFEHVVAPNEGAAVAVASGHYLATGTPALVYMQNSGLGNAVNPLVSLASPTVYGIPMVLLIGWRGEPGVRDEPQHEHQGAITIEQLKLLDAPALVVDSDDVAAVLRNAVTQAISRGGPVAVVVRKGTFASPAREKMAEGFHRKAALGMAVDTLPRDSAFVATTGFTGREMALIRDERGESWDRDMLMIGSMGHASALAFGIARAKPDRIVCCLDGDGAVAMHMGSLAMIGAELPVNFIHMILNNGVHESVGGQPSALRSVDIPALAKGVGYAYAAVATDQDELATALGNALDPKSRPAMIEVRIEAGTVENLPRPSAFKQRANAMKEWLTGV